jgi:hypothetical protein
MCSRLRIVVLISMVVLSRSLAGCRPSPRPMPRSMQTPASSATRACLIAPTPPAFPLYAVVYRGAIVPKRFRPPCSGQRLDGAFWVRNADNSKRVRHLIVSVYPDNAVRIDRAGFTVVPNTQLCSTRLAVTQFGEKLHTFSARCGVKVGRSYWIVVRLQEGEDEHPPLWVSNDPLPRDVPLGSRGYLGPARYQYYRLATGLRLLQGS